MNVATATKEELRVEIKRLADLANQENRNWTDADEVAWKEANAAFDRRADYRSMPGREDIPPKKKEESMRHPSLDDNVEYFRDVKTGDRVRAVKLGESFVDAVAERSSYERSELARHYEGLTLGRMLRALATGAQDETERRTLSEGTNSAGGYTVPSILSARLIDAMRKKTRVFQAGAVAVPLDSAQHSFAKLLTDPTPGWRSENAAVAESDPTFGTVTFTPRSLAVKVKVSEELLQDSLNIETALTNALAQALAVELDRVALLGTGTAPQPRGVTNFSGINSVSMGTNGAAPGNYSQLLDAVKELYDDNGEFPTAAIMAPRTWRTYAGLVDADNQPLRRPDAIVDLPFLQTTSIPVNQTQGTNSDCSTIITGNFTELVIGMRQRLRIEVLNELYRDNLQVGFVAHLRADVAAWHEESFCKIIGLR